MTRRARGRPRQERVDEALAVAVPAMLREQGYDRVTVDSIAAAAGVGKPAIYRRYKSKAELVFAIMVHGVAPDVPDEGTFRADIGWLVERAHQDMTGAATLMPGFLADVLADPELTARFRGTFVAGQRAAITLVCGKAVARGELKAQPAAELAHSVLLGPLFMRLLVLREAMSPAQLTDHAEAVVRALSAE